MVFISSYSLVFTVVRVIDPWGFFSRSISAEVSSEESSPDFFRNLHQSYANTILSVFFFFIISSVIFFFFNFLAVSYRGERCKQGVTDPRNVIYCLLPSCKLLMRRYNGNHFTYIRTASTDNFKT